MPRSFRTQALGRGVRWGSHVPPAACVGNESARRLVGGVVGTGEFSMARLEYTGEFPITCMRMPTVNM